MIEIIVINDNYNRKYQRTKLPFIKIADQKWNVNKQHQIIIIRIITTEMNY
mgnify:CR=1 FL=1